MAAFKSRKTSGFQIKTVLCFYNRSKKKAYLIIFFKEINSRWLLWVQIKTWKSICLWILFHIFGNEKKIKGEFNTYPKRTYKPARATLHHCTCHQSTVNNCALEGSPSGAARILKKKHQLAARQCRKGCKVTQAQHGWLSVEFSPCSHSQGSPSIQQASP